MTDQTPEEIQDSVNKKVVMLTYIAIASFVLIYTYIQTWSIFSRRLETRLRDRYFMKVLLQDAAFFDKRQAGEISSRLNSDIQAIQTGTSEKVGICMACTSFFVTAYVVAFIKNTKLAAMLICLIPAFLMLAGFGSYFSAKFASNMSDRIASASSIASETLSNIPVVQAFGAGPRLEAIFASRMDAAKTQGIKKAFVAALQAGMLYFIAYAANALSFWQGSKQITEAMANDGKGATVGDIYTVILLLVDGKQRITTQCFTSTNSSFSLYCPWFHCAPPSPYWCRGWIFPEAPPGHGQPSSYRCWLDQGREAFVC